LNLSAERLNPLCDGRLACARWRSELAGRRSPRGRIQVSDLAIGDRRAERLHAGVGDAAVSQIEHLQFFQRLHFVESRVCYFAAVPIQIPHLPKLGEDLCTGVRDLASQEVQPAKRSQLAQMFYAVIGDLHAVEVQVLQSSQIAQVFQALVGDQRAQQV